MDRSGIPLVTAGAALAIADMLDNCARLEAGQEVILLADADGLHGGDNLVDEVAIAWIKQAAEARGANVTVMWIEERAKVHEWRLPPVLKAAISACDLIINHSFDLSFEEIVELKQYLWEKKKLLVRNYATTAELLNTAWAQTPHELVSEIRYQAAVPLKPGLAWELTDASGSHLTGRLEPAYNPHHQWFTDYTVRREVGGGYRPFPEWVVPPIRMSGISGAFVFDRMLSWWSRYIGISPFFAEPIRLEIVDGRIVKIEGGAEARALKAFLADMVGRVGDKVYDFNALHFGVHPQASVTPAECPSLLYRRLVEHAQPCNIHVHVGGPPPTDAYPFWMHCTGDTRTATFRVGDTLVHDRGHLTALDHPDVLAVARKYPGRPGLPAVGP
jgi:hypothetical protein